MNAALTGLLAGAGRYEDDLEAILAHILKQPRRLLVLDFDGTLSPIVDHPGDATLAEGAMAALRSAAEHARIVILSGRTVQDLEARMDGLPFPLVGCHGAEARRADGSAAVLFDTSSLAPTLVSAQEKIGRITAGSNGWLLERKPSSLAVHHRLASAKDVDQLLPRVHAALAAFADEPPGWEVMPGKAVLELRPEGVDKGEAMQWIAQRYRGHTPVMIGDDITDEDGFRAANRLGGAAAFVAGRPRRTAARWRLADPLRVVTLLAELGAVRETIEVTPSRPRYHPIESYGMIGDSRTAALVSPDGSIDWMCTPRFDSPSVFAALLDADRGGRFRIAPPLSEGLTAQRTYLGDTNVLVTRFVRDGEPILTLTDLLVYSRVNSFNQSSTGHTLLRRLEAHSDVAVELEFQPRFDFGRARTAVELTETGVRASAGMEYLDLEAEGIAFEVGPGSDGAPTATGRVDLRRGEERWLLLQTPGHERGPHRHLAPPQLLDLTVRTWGRWARLIRYDGPWREHVVRSTLVLKGLVYEPTGALVAAPTTSLPEFIGGARNWDYRYSWIRDSAYVLETFLRVGHAREAETFIRWLSELGDRIGGTDDLRPLYPIGGTGNVSEFELPHLEGYEGSRPVRIGNAAADQLQLDIYGALMHLGYLTEQLGGEVPSARWPVIVQLVDTVRRRWREPDSGLWEVRSEPRHHVFSKFMCWLAIDRASRIGHGLGLRGPYTEWEQAATEIRDDVLSNGYDPHVGAFTQAYGSSALDASVLLLPLKGFIAPTDERVRSTVAAIRRDLEVSDGLLLRYRSTDGIDQPEGAFLLCSFWLVELLARMGDLNEATRIFERLIAMAGPLGLFAEEVDPALHSHLGNYPQAFTHMGLIAAATAIAEEQVAHTPLRSS